MEGRTARRLSEVVLVLAAGCVVLALVIDQGWGDAACLVSATLLVGVGLACRQAARTELVYRFRDGVPVWNPPGPAVDSNVDRQRRKDSGRPVASSQASP